MSTKPAETLVDAAPVADGFAQEVEAHLDHHPLPVDEAEIDRIATRLRARIHPKQSMLPWVVGGLLVLAAAMALVSARIDPTDQEMSGSQQPPAQAARVEVAEETRKIRLVEAPGEVALAVGRTLWVAPASTVLLSDAEQVAVLLVQAGEVTTDDVRIPVSHWAVLGPAANHLPPVIFPDGELPPESLQNEPWERIGVDRELKDLRWASVPTKTHDALAIILERQ